MITYEQHPIGKCYPLLTVEQVQKLEEVALNSFDTASPVYLYEGKILDGWHWYNKCRELGRDPIFEEFTGTDPVSFVIRRHEGRRHLLPGQLASIGEELATLQNGCKPTFARGAKVQKTRNEVASELKISTRSMDSVRAAKKFGIPEIVDAVKNGQIGAGPAEDIARLPKDEQPAALEKAVEKKTGPKQPKAKRKSKPGAPKIVARQPKWVPLTPEESGFPVNGTMREQDAHMAKYGRVQIHPKVIHDIREHNATLTWISSVIDRVASDDLPTAEACCEAVVALKAWVPQPERGEEYAINYANKARTHIANINERLPIAIERLTKLYDLWQARKT